MEKVKRNYEAEAAQIALDHAKRRWPFANRVTNPQLMDAIDELKAKIRRADGSNQSDDGDRGE